MKKTACIILTLVLCLLFSGCTCQHEVEIVDSKASTCMQKGYDLYKCKKCEESYTVEKDAYGAHVYAEDTFSCQARACIIESCAYIEAPTTQHTYTQEYICSACMSAKECTLKTLGNDFSAQILEQARKNAGELIGNFEIVILDAENTILNLQNYIINPKINDSEITGGLFVKFDVTYGTPETLFTVYYNFGLQFSEEQTDDLAFTYDGSDEIWYLEVVEGNKTILFEYSIL